MIDIAAIRLPAEVWEALDDLYGEARRQEWLTRYAVACRRNRLTMRYLALKEAGYPTDSAYETRRLTNAR